MKGGLRCMSILLAFSSVFGNLTFTETEEGLTIKYNDLTIFYHTTSIPIFSIGTGDATFINTAGNFVINDTVSTKKNLNKYDPPVLTGSTKLEVTFSSSDNSSVEEVKLLLNETRSAVTDVSVLNLEAILSGNDGGTYNRIFMNIFATNDEKVYGGGEQYTYFNLKGYSFPIWTSEQGVGRDNSYIANASNLDGGAGGSYYTTYWPQASYFSSRFYSFFLNNRQYLELNFENSNRNMIYSHSTYLSGCFLKDTTAVGLIPRISKLIGRQPVLPDWILKGAALGLEGGTDEIMSRYEEAKSADVDVNSLWIQDWSGTTHTTLLGYRVYWNWEYNETLYQDFEGTIDSLSQEGVQMMVYCNPHLIEGSSMYEEADANGYLLKDSEGNSFLQDFGGFYGGTIDLLSEKARDWYSDQLNNNMVGIGIKGWMADFGEYTDLQMFSNNTDYGQEELHNLMPVAWAETNKKIINGSEDIVYFMRSGGLGSSGAQRLAWAGDQNVDFSIGDGVASTIVAALSLAVSGMGLTHFDIGGFTTLPILSLTRSRELLLRSAEYAVFTPFMRTHLGNKPNKNFQIFDNRETLEAFGRLTQIHSRLFEYTLDLVKQNSEEGIPVQRPMFYHYESDPHAWDLMYQYMYGPDLIVAPVINEAQYEVEVYIPEGDNATWVPLWSEEGESQYQTGPNFVTIPAPIGFPAVLYRLNSNYTELFESINADYGGSPP